MRNYLLEQAQASITVIRTKPLFFPVRFDLPDEIRETNPASQTRKLEGQFLMRFYCTPQKGDRITRFGLVWEVIYLAHSPQLKGSSKQDACPIVMTEFVDSVEE